MLGPRAGPRGDTLERLKIAVVGHVDHGKSTLVGRLFHDTNSLPEGKFEAIKEMCDRRGMPFEWAFLMDAFQAERDQGVTIDTAQIWFHTARRDYVIIDAPGHSEFLKNMITGAAKAEAALLVIDAHEGVRAQSRRHGYLLNLLGIEQVCVVVNKMDAVDYGQARFRAVEDEIGAYLGDIGIVPSAVVPVSARAGDNVALPSARMSWYRGPTMTEALDGFSVPPSPVALPLRMPVQDVYKFDNRRIIAGRIETGRLKRGDRLVFSPSNKSAHVATIEVWNARADEACAGQSIGITLDEQLFVERGELASHAEALPVETNVFRAKIFWLAHEALKAGNRYKLKLATSETPVEVQSVDWVINPETLERIKGETVERHGFAELVLRTRSLLALDDHKNNPRTGRFVLVDGYDIAGGGVISMEGYPDQRALVTVKSTNVSSVAHRVTVETRARHNQHQGGVLWFTGLSGAGKSTIALELEQRLFRKGYQVYVLDGDNLRVGLNANLGFSPEDRAENIRRVGEVAALFAEAGFVVITAFISPYRSDRDRARAAAERQGSGNFHEVYVSASLEVCEKRDPKGLYRKARAGKIDQFTGISAPYEAPEAPELTLPTDALSLEECVEAAIDYLERHFRSG
ncbi:MAG: adenylyl-sulfate kinase [Proteobacteria bacterium]|nr:adenylyl-sulfate kinase [Pseudomonadota bacterium]